MSDHVLRRDVLGIAFDETNVILIEKTHPEFLAGKLNGVGGKVEEGESAIEAMIREFFEETGVRTQASQWIHKGSFTVEAKKRVIELFTATIPGLGTQVRTTTDEVVVVIPKNEFKTSEAKMMYNLPYIIDVCQQPWLAKVYWTEI